MSRSSASDGERGKPTATAQEISFAKALEVDVEPLIASIVELGTKSAEPGQALLLVAIALCEIARRETQDDALLEVFIRKALAAGRAYSLLKRIREARDLVDSSLVT